MALNKLKKWIGGQLFETFMEEYNQNVDATNAAIDLAETNSANISLMTGGPSQLWAGSANTGALTLSESASNFICLILVTSDESDASSNRSSILVSSATSAWRAPFYHGDTFGQIRLIISDMTLNVISNSVPASRVLQVYGLGRKS